MDPQSDAESWAEAGTTYVQHMGQLRTRIAEYQVEIEAVREARDAAAKKEYTAVGDVLRAWAELKDARTALGFASTGHALHVYRQPADEAADRSYVKAQVCMHVCVCVCVHLCSCVYFVSFVLYFL